MSKTWAIGEQIAATDINMMVCPLATVLPFGGITVPSNWLLCDGSAVSRATYSDLFDEVCKSLGTFTVTIASPAIFTKTTHGLVAGDAVYFTSTGALPTGLVTDTIYYVTAAGLTASDFEVSATRGGSAIVTTGSQAGTHTVRRTVYGIGNGSTTFNIPDLTQRIPVGYKSADTMTGYLGQSGGEETHTLTIPEIPAHTHNMPVQAGGTSDYQKMLYSANYTGRTFTEPTTSVGGDTAHNNMQPYITMQYIIRY